MLAGESFGMTGAAFADGAGGDSHLTLFITPAPGSCVLMGVGAVVVCRRRR